MDAEMLAVAARTFNAMSWFVLGCCASVSMGIALSERKDDYMYASLGICALIFGRSVVWLLS